MIFFNAQPGVLRKRVQLCAVALLGATGMAQAESCRAESFSGASYAVCSFNPVKDHLRTYWRGNHGKPFRTFDALAADLEAKRTRSSGYVDRRSRAPLTVFFYLGYSQCS